jgi:hypothetical protein
MGRAWIRGKAGMSFRDLSLLPGEMLLVVASMMLFAAVVFSLV